jgi:predicted ATP-binding protein involved in virulence
MEANMTDFDITSRRFWLQRIALKNYRCFQDITVDFDERLTILSARNGAGKTAVLDAIAVAFGTFVGSFYTGKSKGIDVADVRLKLTRPELREMEPQYPAVISAQAEICEEKILDKPTPVKWSRCLSSPKSRTTVKEARFLTAIGQVMQHRVTEQKPVVLPLVAYYGTGRLWQQKKNTDKKTFEREFYSRTSGYQDCLDPASNYKSFENWFAYAAHADSDLRNQQREKLGDNYVETDTPYSPLMAAVRQAVDKCLQITGWRNLRYSFVHRTVTMEHAEHGVLEVEQLSDGVRNMIGLVADIAYRTVRLNSWLGRDAVSNTPGLVLIDEVDMHLHPEWQQVVLRDLTAAFHKLQFVVTTHSPQVLSTVKREQIRLLTENIAGEAVAVPPEARTYGRSNADVLQTVMNVFPEPTLPESPELEEYLKLVEKGDWRSNRAGTLRQHLALVLGEDHPSLIRADMIVRRREALEK